jgi:hypothetical protein
MTNVVTCATCKADASFVKRLALAGFDIFFCATCGVHCWTKASDEAASDAVDRPVGILERRSRGCLE